MVLFGANRRAGAARQARGLRIDPSEVAIGLAHEAALRSRDASQYRLGDGEPAPRGDRAEYFAIAKYFFVVVALFIAVVEAAHWCVAPIDDADPRLGV